MRARWRSRRASRWRLRCDPGKRASPIASCCALRATAPDATGRWHARSRPRSRLPRPGPARAAPGHRQASSARPSWRSVCPRAARHRRADRALVRGLIRDGAPRRQERRAARVRRQDRGRRRERGSVVYAGACASRHGPTAGAGPRAAVADRRICRSSASVRTTVIAGRTDLACLTGAGRRAGLTERRSRTWWRGSSQRRPVPGGRVADALTMRALVRAARGSKAASMSGQITAPSAPSWRRAGFSSSSGSG